ncbi:MAG: hypothetical protein FJZ56_01890 [Chlamydiae bacterium]|nr:hypothetical protein [Chlamydiota bacterium]
MSAPINVAENGLVNGWEGFTNFFAEDIPVFFTQTVPNAFEQGWNSVSQWVDEFVKPFFESCHEWFSDNAVWIWPAAIAFVAGAALVSAIAISIFYCCRPLADDESETASNASHRSGSSRDSNASHVSSASNASHVSNASHASHVSNASIASHVSAPGSVVNQQNPIFAKKANDELDMMSSLMQSNFSTQIGNHFATNTALPPPVISPSIQPMARTDSLTNAMDHEMTAPRTSRRKRNDETVSATDTMNDGIQPLLSTKTSKRKVDTATAAQIPTAPPVKLSSSTDNLHDLIPSVVQSTVVNILCDDSQV